MVNVINFRSFGYNYSRVLEFRKKNLSPNRFFSRGSYTFSKFFKIKGCKSMSCSRSYKLLSYSPLSSGVFIQLISKFPKFGYLTDFQIKACKNLLKKPYKRFLILRAYPYLGLTKKPAEVRMGKGKGSKISHYVFPMRAGFLIAPSLRRMNPKISDLRFQGKVTSYLAKLPFSFLFVNGSF